MALEPKTKLCPRCQRDSMDGPNCLFCGPDVAAPSRPANQVHEGWKGFDRDLGSRVKAERAREAEEERRNAEPRRGRAWIVSAIIAVIVCSGVGYLAMTGRLSREVPDSVTGIPQRLKKGASAARPDLALYARSLRELAIESQRKLLSVDEASLRDVASYRRRLENLHDTGRALEPKLTREERRVLSALQRSERMVDAFLRSFETEAPDILGTNVAQALEQISRGLAVIRGEKVEDLVVTYAKKASAAAELQRALDGK